MRPFVFDTETYLIEPGNVVPWLVSLGFSEDRDPVQLRLRKDSEDAVSRALADPTVRFVGHNVAFDFAVVLRAFPHLAPAVWRAYDTDRVWDTMLWAQLESNAEGKLSVNRHSLSACHERITGQPLAGKDGEDAWRLRYSELDDKPIVYWPEAATSYAKKDVEATQAVYDYQVALPLPPTFHDQVKAAWALHLISAWGMRTCPDKVAQFTDKVHKLVAERNDLLASLGVLRDNGTKDMAVLRELIEQAYAKSGRVAPRTAKHAISTSKTALLESGDETLKKIADLGISEKIATTFIPVLEQGTTRAITPRFTTIRETGRTSCSKPNLQNMPSDDDLRSCFVPRKDNVFIGCDYHVAELASLAQVLKRLYGHSKMASALSQGLDLHLVTAAAILHIPYEECARRHREGDKEVKRARTLSKAANFGYPAGLGKRFVEYAAGFGIEMDVSQASRLKQRWLDLYPEMRQFFDDLAVRPAAWTFRHPITGFIRGGVTFTSGANTYFQHLTACGAKRALYYLVRATKIEPDSPLFGCAVVNFVHDEVILECPSERRHEVAKEVERLMCVHMRFYLTDVPVKADAHAMDCWAKSAQAVYDEDGRLGVWRHASKDGKDSHRAVA